MIYILERFILKPELASDAENIMQILDEAVGPAAHRHPGWCGHASFFQSDQSPPEILMLYPWKSLELHADLFEKEEPALATFYEQYCAAPRQISIYHSLAVDVEHEHASETEHQPNDRKETHDSFR